MLLNREEVCLWLIVTSIHKDFRHFFFFWFFNCEKKNSFPLFFWFCFYYIWQIKFLESQKGKMSSHCFLKTTTKVTGKK